MCCLEEILMNQKLMKKLILDFAMTVLMIFLMDYFVTGLLWHEIIGVVVLVLIVKHNLVNLNWYRGILKSKNTLPVLVKIRLLVTILLTISSVVLGISSIVISQYLFAFLNFIPGEIWIYLHRVSAYTELILIGIHIGLHGEMILRAFRKMFHIEQDSKVRTFFIRSIALLFAIFGIRSSVELNLYHVYVPESEADETNNSTLIVNAKEEETPTLNEYLDGMTCTACHKHCSLLNPRCNRGERQVEEAEAEYLQLYQADEEIEEIETQSTVENADTITFEVEEDSELKDLFLNYIPLMGIFVLGSYYGIKVIDRKTK